MVIGASHFVNYPLRCSEGVFFCIVNALDFSTKV